ncbi:Putative ATPase [Acidipropionibacterium acidipropionici ATCC 4875]|uniref:ATPase n=1 Tax=Acidipropionibacterium acidipropionici (strain ATCC 4875 / DSM 20272 / JCM 6432 / NBRC 12425 / NCIMB 8070 / 4) TaxID=1171373 RepID=K7SP84_ACIA4|nr:AAA family ATPase [Acidipropionibacterium acidipropionici]AFV91040.1 Putative ATPase [Acidipropionibacterium acidipropionici ATCC 4875]
MRLHRIHVENFKSVEDRTLELPDTGLVIAEGLNEVGKTSMVEALDMLLDPKLKATSKSAKVKTAQPYGTDLPVIVEAELTVGGVRLVHSKRFLAQPAARLEFLSGPRAGDVLTDERATDTMAEIWAGTDQTLWRALRHMQSDSLEALSLKSSTALTSALDRASRATDDESGHRADDTTLLEAAEQEFAKYWTGTGKPGKPLKDATSALEQSEAELDAARRELDEVDTVVAELQTAEEDLRAQRRDVGRLETESAADATALKALEGLEQQVAEARRAERDARQRLDTAASARQARRQAVEEVDVAGQQVSEATAAVEKAHDAAGDVEEEYREADERWDACEKARLDARRAWQEARATVSGLRDRDRLARLDAVIGRLSGLRNELREAESRLEGNFASAKGLKAAEKASARLAAARTKLEVASPRMRIERLRDDAPALAVDGRPIEDEEDGDAVDRVVDRPAVVEVADAWRITVTPASDVDKLAHDVERAERELTEALEPMGADTLEAARELLAARGRDENLAAGLRERLERELTDVDEWEDDSQERSVAGLTELRDRLAARVGEAAEDDADADGTGAAAGSGDVGDAGLTVGQAEEAATRCEAAHDQAELAEKAARAAREAVGERRSAAREADSAAASTLTAARGQAERLAARLEEARGIATDEDLDARVEAEDTAHQEAEGEFEKVSGELAEHSPDEVREAARASRARFEKASERLGRTGTRWAGLDGQLRGMDRSGRQDRFDDMEGRVHRLRIKVTALTKRADAARLLRDTLVRHRDEERRRYLEPFTRQIETLGRGVFGADLAVRVDDSLTVTQRRLGGKWLAWDQLSTGAKEQLGLVVRLATARLVSPEDGVPVILDDALVYSDRVRCERVLKEVSSGSQANQVVVFTSAPERYDAVEAVHVDFR